MKKCLSNQFQLQFFNFRFNESIYLKTNINCEQTRYSKGCCFIIKFCMSQIQYFKKIN